MRYEDWKKTVEGHELHDFGTMPPALAQVLTDRLKKAFEAGGKIEHGEDLDLHAAIQHAAGSLPDGWSIEIDIERDSGCLTLFDPSGHQVEFPTNRETMAEEVREAVTEACALHAAGHGPAFDPDLNCPTHFTGADPTCSACRAKQGRAAA